MKTSLKLIASLLVLALAACQLPSTGTLTIQVPAASRAVNGHGDAVRLQLLRNSSIVPLSGKSFLQDSLSGQTIKIDGLPVGSGYSLNLSTGTVNSDGYFEVAYAGTSASFEISAGAESNVGVTLNTTPVHLFASGAGPHKSTVLNDGSEDTLYFTKNGALFGSTDGTVPGSSILALDPNLTLNSLGRVLDSSGNPQLTLNTDAGLAVVSGGSATYEAQTENVKETDGYYYNNKAFNFYAGSGLTAGVQVLNGGTAPWDSFSDLMDIPDNLKSSLEGTDEGLIRGFDSNDQFAYISTALAVFRVDTTMLDDSADADALADKFVNGTNDVKIAVKLADRAVGIGPVGAYSDNGAGLAFAGTSKGLFAATTDGDGKPVGGYDSLALVGGTLGLDVAKVKTSSKFAGSAYTAAYAQNTGDIVLLKDKAVLKVVPRLAGLPAGRLSLAWFEPNSSKLQLAVSGDDGTVLVDVAESIN